MYVMDDFEVQEKIMRLRVTIRQQQQKIEALAAEVVKLEKQLAPIQARYDRIVAPIADKVLVLREAVRDLESLRRRQARGVTTEVDDLWQDKPWNKRTQEGFFQRAQQAMSDEPPIPTKRPEASADIKTVYRRLARRFHPDLAPNPVEEARRNTIMAQINNAYAERDLEGLLAIEGPGGASGGDAFAEADLSLNELKLQRMQEESAELSARLEDLKIQKFDLTHNVLFDLKLQEKWDKRRGRNPLQEMADWFEGEYTRLSQRLAELRRNVD